MASAPGKRLGVGRHLPGRGAWLCPDSTGCLQTAAQRGAFNRALRTDVGAIDLAYLEAELSGRARIRPDRTAPGAGKAT